MSAFRAAFRTRNILGTQLFASATPFKRSHSLPPSEMKSLYGSITRSAVISLSYFRFAMLFAPMRSPKSKAYLLNADVRGHSGLFCRRGEGRRILPDKLLHAQRPLPR